MQVFDYVIDGETKQFVRWSTVLPPFNAQPHSAIAADAFVSTVRTQQLQYIMGLLLDHGSHVMLVGTHGAGKSATVSDRVKTVCSGEVAEVQALTIHTDRCV